MRVIVATLRVRLLPRLLFFFGGIFDGSWLLLQNLVTKAPSDNLPAMLVAQLLPFVKNLSQRKWSDEDIGGDVQFLKEELTTHFQNLTYVFLLSLSLTHTSHLWFGVCVQKDVWWIYIRVGVGTPVVDARSWIGWLLERECYQVEWEGLRTAQVSWRVCLYLIGLLTFSFRILIQILQTATDPNILAIAANDVGQYVKHYDRGKKWVDHIVFSFYLASCFFFWFWLFV